MDCPLFLFEKNHADLVTGNQLILKQQYVNYLNFFKLKLFTLYIYSLSISIEILALMGPW